jgi:hypothetical protein
MKAAWKLKILLLIVFAFSLTHSYGQSDEWIRVQSDDGEISFEVPKQHRLFFDSKGFFVSRDFNNDLPLKNMYLLSGFFDDTLISFEMYDAGKAAMEILYDQDAFAKNGRKTNDVKFGEIKIKQIINDTDKYYSIRQFFCTKKRVYIFTTASRGGETPAMRRFLDSKSIAVPTDKPTNSATLLSSFKKTNINVEFEEDQNVSVPKSATKLDSEPNVKPRVIVRAVRPSFVGAARKNNTVGTIRLKLQLAEDGFIPTVIVKRSLPDGLLRQSIFAAIRTKFLPKEKDGKPVSTTSTLEFGFDIF